MNKRGKYGGRRRNWDWVFDLILLPIILVGGGYAIVKRVTRKKTS